MIRFPTNPVIWFAVLMGDRDDVDVVAFNRVSNLYENRLNVRRLISALDRQDKGHAWRRGKLDSISARNSSPAGALDACSSAQPHQTQARFS